MSVLRPASQLALRWMTQLDSLKAMVASDPDSFHAWRWLILIKVLSFLVSRYGDDAQIDLDSTRRQHGPSNWLGEVDRKPLRRQRMGAWYEFWRKTSLFERMVKLHIVSMLSRVSKSISSLAAGNCNMGDEIGWQS